MTKRELASNYFLVIGTVLTVILLGGALRAMSESGYPTAIALVSGIIPSTSLASARYWLPKLPLTDEQLWRVAVYGGLGIAVLTLTEIGLVAIYPRMISELWLLFVIFASNVAVGGIAGLFAGSLWESHRTARMITEKNQVLTRVMRHDIRNDINVICGQAELIEDKYGSMPHTEMIINKANEIAAMSKRARTLQEIFNVRNSETKPVNIVPIIRDLLESTEETDQNVVISSDLPDEAWVWGDEMIAEVVNGLLQNAIQHHDGSSTVRIDIDVSLPGSIGDAVVLTITDNGPGIPRSELHVLRTGETAIRHSDGMGLWLIKWFIEYHGGDINFDVGGDGSQVTISLRHAPSMNAPFVGVDGISRAIAKVLA